MKSSYEFYELTEDHRKAMVGSSFRREMPLERTNYEGYVYFPVNLHPNQFNYGKSQGLIFVTNIFDNNGHKNWFRVGVCSPDDLDIDLDFESPDLSKSEHWRKQTIDFLSDSSNLQNVFYQEVLKNIQKLTGAGKIST